MLNIHLIIFLKSSSVSIFFHLLNSTQASSASPLFARCLSLNRLNNTEIYPIPKRGREENRAPRKCNISVFNIEVYKIRAEMGSMAICLFRYFLRRKKKSAYQCMYFGGPEPLYPSSSYMKNNVLYGYAFIYNGNMRSGLFYNVPYFRLRLTAFYDPPAVHLHVSGRQEHCIIMSFPAPKCYFTGRGSFLKLHHFYNFLNFYSRHYYQQDFITYLECKQVWVMTLPRLPGIIPADGSAAISGVCAFVQTQQCERTPTHAHAYEVRKAARTSALPTYESHACAHS